MHIGIGQAAAGLEIAGGDQHLGHRHDLDGGGGGHSGRRTGPHGAHDQGQADGGNGGDTDDDDTGGLHRRSPTGAPGRGFGFRPLPLMTMKVAG
jgi:hypothetical protein